MNASVEVDGSIGSIQVTDSTNPGHGFEEAAIDAVKRWKYKPALLGEEPVRVFFTVVIEFTFR